MGRKATKDLAISLSGNHSTRGNPKNGCGGFSMRYVLAQMLRTFDLPSRWRIPKVGVAGDRVCVLVCVYIATTLTIAVV